MTMTIDPDRYEKAVWVRVMGQGKNEKLWTSLLLYRC